MKIKVFIAVFFFTIPMAVLADSCYRECLIETGNSQGCSEKCGITTHGSVNVPEHKSIAKTPQVNIKGKADFTEADQARLDECFKERCLNAKSNDSIQECLENCVQANVLELEIESSSGISVPSSRGGDMATEIQTIEENVKSELSDELLKSDCLLVCDIVDGELKNCSCTEN